MIKQWENNIFENLSAFSLLIGKADYLAMAMAEGPRSLEMKLETIRDWVEVIVFATVGTYGINVLQGVAAPCPLLGTGPWVPRKGVGDLAGNPKFAGEEGRATFPGCLANSPAETCLQ